jgi:hypothetical protein
MRTKESHEQTRKIMKQNPITRRAIALTSIALAALALSSFATVAAADPAAPKPPDLTAGGEKDKSHDWLLGPTGLRGWLFYQDGRTTYARQILLTAVDKGSPADGILAVGDVILGVGGKPFDGDARIQFANAITAAETENGGGVLRLSRWRSGQTANVELKLKVLGSYSDTAPYKCPKSKAIFEQGCQLIATGGLKSGDGLYGNLNMLALQASGKEEYRPLLAEYARKLTPRMNLTQMGCWGHAYANLFLAEYVLATGDKEMLAELKRTTMEAVAAQSSYGTWGHGGRKPNGNCSGYGAMNQVGLPMTLSMVLAREAGVKDPALDKAIEKSANFLRWYVDKGAVPYGDHPAWTGSHDDNGKTSLAAVLFDLLGDREATAYFARMATAAYDEREQGHCGNWFNMMWALPGVSRCGPLAAGAYMKEQSWYYELARNWKGGFEYQKINPHDENNNYTSWDLTGTYLLSYGLPLKSLYVNGKKPCSLPPLKSKEVANVIAAGRDSALVNGKNGYAARTTTDLLAGLASWSPAVRKRSAQALAARKDELLPALLKMLAGSDRYARYGAVEALACLGPRADAAAPQLRALLTDKDPWLQSLACQAIRFLGPEAHKACTDDLLRLAATPNPVDPRQTVQRAVGLALFCGYPGVGGPTVLNGSVEGVDRKLLYPAVRAMLENDDSVTRGGPALIYGKLSDRDLAVLLPAIVKAAPDAAPSNEMFADGPRLPAFDVLSKHHIREGMTMIVEALNGDRVGGDVIQNCLDYLLRYGVHAKEILPSWKGKDYWCNRFPERYKAKKEAIEKSTESPPLVSLQEFIEKAAAGNKTKQPQP